MPMYSPRLKASKAFVAAFMTIWLPVKLAFTSPLVLEISQLQSAQDRVVLARTNAIIVRSEHYELVAMRAPGPKIVSLDRGNGAARIL